VGDALSCGSFAPKDCFKAKPVKIALCAVVSGANDCVAMEKFGKSKRAWLEKYLSLPDGTPCHDTLSRVFAAVDG